jgi:hypothetical protein
VEDWEQFFAEKSRRRADKEWRKKRRRRIDALIAVGVVGIAIIGGIAAIALRS